MPPPSPLAIATSSVNRLIKEEASYHKELKSQEARLAKLEASTEEDENAEYQLKQEVFLPLHLPLTSILYFPVGMGASSADIRVENGNRRNPRSIPATETKNRGRDAQVGRST
jgi:hypothetical protein